ncbi:MAG TPA: ComEA family DNA-binding protein [Microbacteriaceae bacterium]|nr:ComEA family DNA-binding protein [Microbacteriaceae bacterium]
MLSDDRFAGLLEFLRRHALALLLAGTLLVVAVGAAISLAGQTPRVATLPRPNIAATAPASEALYVHVAGAVQRPGLVRVPEGSRVVDAIAAAGGPRSDADSDALNLARELRSGEQLIVPVRGQAPNPATSALVNLNTADQAALERLPHVGPAVAARILAYRNAHGGFQSVDELAKVEGLGQKRLADIRPLVCV